MQRNAFLLMILMLLLSISTWADQVIIGTGTSVQRYPLGCYFGYERSASLYTAAEIGTTGDISALEWYATVAQAVTCPVKIYIKTTAATTITADTWASTISGATLVYDGSFNVSLTNSWYPISLMTPFSYGGGTNLMVMVETNYAGTGTGSSSSAQYQYSTATNQHMYIQADTNPP